MSLPEKIFFTPSFLITFDVDKRQIKEVSFNKGKSENWLT
jgi:hypothetical protein